MFALATSNGIDAAEERILTDKQAQKIIKNRSKKSYGWSCFRDYDGNIIQFIFTNSNSESVRQGIIHDGYEKWYCMSKMKNGKWIKGLLAR